MYRSWWMLWTVACPLRKDRWRNLSWRHYGRGVWSSAPFWATGSSWDHWCMSPRRPLPDTGCHAQLHRDLRSNSNDFWTCLLYHSLPLFLGPFLFVLVVEGTGSHQLLLPHPRSSRADPPWGELGLEVARSHAMRYRVIGSVSLYTFMYIYLEPSGSCFCLRYRSL